MPDPSNSSFIPKRGPAKKSRTAVTKRVYLFTVISYIMLFSALLASGGVYFYKGVVKEALAEEVASLNAQISTFSEANMQRVLEFDRRVSQAQSRVAVGVSIPSLFSALEASTARTVKIKSIKLEREGDERLVLEGDMETDTFDSTLFQRRLYQDNQTINTIEVTDFNASNIEGGATGVPGSVLSPTLTFSVTVDFPVSQIPTTVTRSLTPITPPTDFESAASGMPDTTDDLSGDNNTQI